MRSTPPDRNMLSNAANRAETFLIRPSTSSDIEDFYELAKLAGAGFTSLPANEALLAERLASSERAFAGELGVLMLALEDRTTERVIGCAAVKPAGLPRPDFLNFLIEGQSLSPTSRYADLTEVGSLLLHPDYRNSGLGPWLSRSRYLLIATDQQRFGSHIFSELRGVVDEDDRSPFYDAVCAPYFGCSFAEADDRCAHGRQAELNALLPKGTIPLGVLSTDAQAAMAQPHRAGRRALDFLEAEGFRFEGVVDLLDGGPAVVAESQSIKTIHQSFEAPLASGLIDDERAADAYLAKGVGAHFACCRTRVSFDTNGSIICPPDELKALEAGDGSVARVRLVDDDQSRLHKAFASKTRLEAEAAHDNWAD